MVFEEPQAIIAFLSRDFYFASAHDQVPNNVLVQPYKSNRTARPCDTVLTCIYSSNFKR